MRWTSFIRRYSVFYCVDVKTFLKALSDLHRTCFSWNKSKYNNSHRNNENFFFSNDVVYERMGTIIIC